MSQLVSAARPVKTARHLAKIRAIRKVKGAIRWHERAREKRRKVVDERHADRAVYEGLEKWKRDNVVGPIKAAKYNLREDYELGPLRPNRAVGREAESYGVVGMEDWSRPSIPTESQKRRNDVRTARGLDPLYPLVVDDKKFFHIAKDDRVMIMKGREKGKIGVVESIRPESHEVTVKDINKRFLEASALNASESRHPDGKIGYDQPFAMDDVRLVMPYRMTTKDKTGNDVHTWTDVVVDNIVLERHTTGIDPFTGVDYGTREFPEEHRFDPETGLPIFNRYIAGTRRRIQWPWETVLTKTEQDTGVKPSSEASESLIGKLKSPIQTSKAAIKNLTSKLRKPKEDEAKVTEVKLTEEEKEFERIQAKLDQVEKVPELPRGASETLPADFDDDTGRNKAEPSPYTSSFYPTIVYPPFPRQLTSEIREHAKDVETAERNEKMDWYEDKKEITPEERAKRKAAKAEKSKKKAIPKSMKTPLQLRWEVERKKKLEAAEVTKVDREALMIALGRHMAAKQASRRPASSGTETVTELD